MEAEGFHRRPQGDAPGLAGLQVNLLEGLQLAQGAAAARHGIAGIELHHLLAGARTRIGHGDGHLQGLARRKPPLDFLELSGAGLRIPHCFPTGFTLGSVLRITLQEMKRLPLRDPNP